MTEIQKSRDQVRAILMRRGFDAVRISMDNHCYGRQFGHWIYLGSIWSVAD